MQTPRDVLPPGKIDHFSPPLEGIAKGLRNFFEVEDLSCADKRIHDLLKKLDIKH